MIINQEMRKLKYLDGLGWLWLVKMLKSSYTEKSPPPHTHTNIVTKQSAGRSGPREYLFYPAHYPQPDLLDLTLGTLPVPLGIAAILACDKAIHRAPVIILDYRSVGLNQLLFG